MSTSIVPPFLDILVTAVLGLEADSPSDAEELQLLAYELQDQFESVHRRSDHQKCQPILENRRTYKEEGNAR